jgi:hypothetical protein
MTSNDKKAETKTTVNNIIINNYNGNVLKNITNIEPYSNKNSHYLKEKY